MATRKTSSSKDRKSVEDTGGSAANRRRPRRRADRTGTKSKRAVGGPASSRGSASGRASTKSPSRSGASKPTGTSRKKTTSRRRSLRGVGPKEQRMYEHIKESAQESGRYGRRAKEVAARTVMKQHKARGHRKGE